MSQLHLVAPVIALVAWSQVIQVWMFATRFRALRLAGITLKGRHGAATRTGLEGVVPDPVSWKAHNYAHLMEQPTIFYAIIFALSSSATASHSHPCWLGGMSRCGSFTAWSRRLATLSLTALRHSRSVLSVSRS